MPASFFFRQDKLGHNIQGSIAAPFQFMTINAQDAYIDHVCMLFRYGKDRPWQGFLKSASCLKARSL